MSKDGKFNVINFSDAKNGIQKEISGGKEGKESSGFFVDYSMSIFVQILTDIVMDTIDANIADQDSRAMALVCLRHSLKDF